MISEFVVGCEKVINLGNYQSIRVTARVTVVVPEGDDLMQLRRQAQEELRSMLEETYKSQMKGSAP